MYAVVLLFLTLSLGLTKGAVLPVTFDYDCSQIECTTDTDSCPPDSIESEPAPAFDVLYGPEELMPPHDFYDEVEDLGDAVEQHFDELPMELSDVTALPVAANSTLGQLSDDRATKDLETEKGPELVLVKRQLHFDNGPTEAIDEHERMLQICCPSMTLESLQRRRRRRYSSVEDCKCKPCGSLPQCANAEVAVRVHEAKGVPGDCCPTYACAPKRECSDADVQPYWRDACTRCSCHGENGPELCHNECPMNEMGEIETQHSCYAADSNEPMLHGSDWYENNWCTKCHCENGERECVGSLCMPTTCSNPVKVPGQCCPQCPVGVENVLIAHENSTDISKSSRAEKELQSESTTTTTVATILDNSTTKNSSEPAALATFTLTSIESMSSESSTAHIALQNQSASNEEKAELTYASSTTTDVSTTSTDVSASTTESTTTTRSIDDIASESYFGPVIHTSTEESSTSTHEILDQTGENTTQSILESKADISTPTSSSNSESTSTVEPTSTPAFVSSTSETVSTETSTIEASSSTENSKEFSMTTSASVADNASTTVAASNKEVTTSTETSQETPLAIGNTESTTTTNFKPTESTTTELDSTSTTIGISSTTLTDSTTTISTTPLVSLETSSTDLYSSSTSSPLPSTARPQTSTTHTTNSPYSSTAATQTVSTVISWYTFSTSAPSPPIPQPTVYQPSVRQFFTRPEVRYIGATVFVAFTVICALAVWKFCMPSRSERLKNHYRTVPSSEATSLSHISSTSHSSMA
ncbi:serine-rich adhesin for platelets [Bactrocera dorsalis]|uniref:Serine-rich adhesin for platelets n=1 Tax=Bactrocera dorsalis TaxID=27457 RepID=A0ABM3JX11_BACDO|nr:serine-rich adhesin for platelets [Bactrocera dorsalis]XP_049313771.1 serine-rich adhesin for platelets [Bactrocera dorsalis]